MCKLKCFISYRRHDLLVKGMIHRFYDELTLHFGGDNIFFDIDTIPPGQDFHQVLDSAVAKADVLLAVIGPDWANILKKRKKDPRDYVRIEIESALRRKIPIVPVLIDQTRIPSRRQLPADIRDLAARHWVQIDSGSGFVESVRRLIANLDKHYSQDLNQLSHLRSPPLNRIQQFPKSRFRLQSLVPMEFSLR